MKRKSRFDWARAGPKHVHRQGPAKQSKAKQSRKGHKAPGKSLLPRQRAVVPTAMEGYGRPLSAPVRTHAGGGPLYAEKQRGSTVAVGCEGHWHAHTRHIQHIHTRETNPGVFECSHRTEGESRIQSVSFPVTLELAAASWVSPPKRGPRKCERECRKPRTAASFGPCIGSLRRGPCTQ